MAYILGESVEEALPNLAASGLTFTRTASYVDNVSTVFAPTFTEISAGFYKYTYTPIQTGSHSWVGTSSGGDSITINFEVDPVESVAGLEAVDEAFYVGATGQAFTRTASYIDNVAVAIAPTFTETGGGFYRYTYTPTVTGSHSWVGTSTNGTPITINFEVDGETTETTVVTVPATAVGGLSLTRQQLRKEIANRFGDYVLLTASANGTTTTLIDTARVGSGHVSFLGREVIFTAGNNVGLRRRVTGSAANGTITFAAVTSATETNDQAEAFNKESNGFDPWQYDDAINNAINAAFSIGLVEVVSTIVAAFDRESPEITVPTDVYSVHTVEFLGDDGVWRSLPRGGNGFGWQADPASGELRLEGWPGSMAHTSTLRVAGYGRHPTLDADDDVCVLNKKFIVAHAGYELALSAVGRDVRFERLAGQFLQELNYGRTAMRTLQKASSRKVRAA